MAAWQAYFIDHGPMREFWRMTAMICRTVAQAQGIKCTLEDFMPMPPADPLPVDPKAAAEALKQRFMAALPPTGK